MIVAVWIWFPARTNPIKARPAYLLAVRETQRQTALSGFG